MCIRVWASDGFRNGRPRNQYGLHYMYVAGKNASAWLLRTPAAVIIKRIGLQWCKIENWMAKAFDREKMSIRLVPRATQEAGMYTL